MHYVGIRRDYRANTNPLRSLPLVRSAAYLFGPTPQDRQIGALRNALWVRPGWARNYAAACAKLGRANRADPKWRSLTQRDAMRELNQVRAKMRANAREIARLEAQLLADGADPAAWAQAAACH